MNKKDLRNLYLQKRRGLSPDDVLALSQQIIEQFKNLLLGDIKFVHLFYPITGKQEFNCLLLKEHFKSVQPRISFVLPKSNIESHTLSNILWEESTSLAMNQWGITEPEDGIEVESRAIDLVIIPLLAYDKQGNRIGYGKGFYDRFLAGCRADVYKVGISYFGPEEVITDVDVYDIPLDICVTPEKIWHFPKPY